jgi:ATP-dependent DNA ligase
VETALKNRHRQFVIDGEAVVLGVDGVSDFDALHSGKHNDEVQLYAFDRHDSRCGRHREAVDRMTCAAR